MILVTGATGFIGGHLVRRLVRDGHQVRAFIRPTSDYSWLEPLGVDIAVGDLTDALSVRRAVDGCSRVFHCGAMVTDWALPREISAVNVDGTRNVTDAALTAGVERVVVISSTDVTLRNWYGRTKLAAEAEVRRAVAVGSLGACGLGADGLGADGFDAVILRPATVYGPGSREVVLEIARALRRGQMVLIENGRANAGLVYVENLVDAAMLAMWPRRTGGEHGTFGPNVRYSDGLAQRSRPDAASGPSGVASGDTVTVTDGVDVTWRQFVDDLADGLGCSRARWNMPYRVAEGLGFGLEHGYRALRAATGLKTRPLLSRQAVQVMGIDQSFSSMKAREQLGWEPRVDYPSGLAATLDWLRSELGSELRSELRAGGSGVSGDSA